MSVGRIFIERSLSACILLAGCLCQAQQIALTNADVIREVKLNYPAEQILAHIKDSRSAFTFDDRAMLSLAKAGVPREIMLAMFEAAVKHQRNNLPAPVPQPAPPSVQPPEIKVKSQSVIAAAAPAPGPNDAPAAPFSCPVVPVFSSGLTPAKPYVRTGLNPVPSDNMPKQVYAVYKGSLNNTGNQVVGEHTVVLEFANILRFDFQVGSATTFANGPTIPSTLALGVSSFPSVKPPSADTTKKAVPTPDNAADRFTAQWRQALQCYSDLQKKIGEMDGDINSAAISLQTTLSRVTATLNDNSTKLVTDFHGLRSTARAPTIFADYVEFPWPTQDLNNLATTITTFQTEYVKLATSPDYAAWAAVGSNKASFDFITSQTTSMLQHVAGLSITSDSAVKIKAAQDSANQWLKHFDKVGSASEADFVYSYDASCDAWFGKSKSTVVSITTRDLLNPTAAAESGNVVTVVCNPPITISTGLGMSFLTSRTPAFVPTPKLDANGKPVLDDKGNPVITQVLGYSYESNVRPVYALQINTAIYEFANGIGIHGSIGADVGTANDTTTVGFLAGPSLSFFRRTLYVTPAYQLAQRSDFAYGFKAGDPQGNLTSVPTKNRWKSGFVLNFTFGIPQ